MLDTAQLNNGGGGVGGNTWPKVSQQNIVGKKSFLNHLVVLCKLLSTVITAF